MLKKTPSILNYFVCEHNDSECGKSEKILIITTSLEDKNVWNFEKMNPKDNFCNWEFKVDGF